MVECDALEMRFGGNVNVGSNPTLSVQNILDIAVDLILKASTVPLFSNQAVNLVDQLRGSETFS